MINDNNHLAAGLLVTLPIMNYLRLQSAHRLIRAGLVLAMVLALFAILGSYSRGALVGLAAVLTVLWLRSPNKVVTAASVVALMLAAVSVLPPQWFDRMATLQAADQTLSGQSRLAMWEAGWRMAVGRPLTGGGFMGPYTQSVISTYAPGTIARAVHSIWFETLGEHGFPTFLVWVGITACGVWNTFRITRDCAGIDELQWCRDLARMAQVSIVAYLVAGSFLSLGYWDFYFTLLVVIAAGRAIVAQAVRDRTAVPAVSGRPWERRRPVPIEDAAAGLPVIPWRSRAAARSGQNG